MIGPVIYNIFTLGKLVSEHSTVNIFTGYTPLLASNGDKIQVPNVMQGHL